MDHSNGLDTSSAQGSCCPGHPRLQRAGNTASATVTGGLRAFYDDSWDDSQGGQPCITSAPGPQRLHKSALSARGAMSSRYTLQGAFRDRGPRSREHWRVHKHSGHGRTLGDTWGTLEQSEAGSSSGQ